MSETHQNRPPEDEPRRDEPDLQRARTGTQPRLAPIWIVPVVALLIGLWLVYDDYLGRGPEIILIMRNAEGIEAGKTLIKARNVEVGRVERMSLSEDHSHARIIARMSPDTQSLLVKDTHFWVVKPRIGREGISGLGTVLSGAFIQLEPGESEEQARQFRVSDQPPVAPPGAEGLRISLVSELDSSLQVGDPVTYRGFTVGRVEKTAFDPRTRRMRHGIFIEAPYDTLVTEGSRFWATGGINMRLDASGLRVKVDALESLLGGGVTFGVPEGLPPGGPAQAESRYTLYPDEESAREGTFNHYLEYVLLVEETVRGLSVGAPVEFRGVRFGTVAVVPWQLMAPRPGSPQGFSIPVLIRIEPQRLGIEHGELDLDTWRERLRGLFDQGLRASLKSSNLLTGTLFVDLAFQRDAAGEYRATTFLDRPEFPSVPGGGAQLEAQVSGLLSKLNQLEIEPLLENLDRSLAASEAMLVEVRELSAGLRELLDDPQLREVPSNLNGTLITLQQTLEGLSPQSTAYQALTEAAQGLERLIRELQPAARTLSDDPRALIFGRPQGRDPQPRAPRPGSGSGSGSGSESGASP